MIESVALTRAQWLRVAVDIASAHAAPARRQLAAHLDQLADERTDDYFSGLADAVRLTNRHHAVKPPHWN